MRKVSFFWPLFMSAAIHLGLFAVDFSPIREREEARQTPSSISLKLVTSMRVRQSAPEPVIKMKPAAAVKPPQAEPPKPLKKVSPEPKPKIKTAKQPEARPEKKAAVLKKAPVVRKRVPEPVAKTAAKAIPSTEIPAADKSPEPVPPDRGRDVNPAPTKLASIPERSETGEVSVSAKILGSVRPTYPRYSRRHDQEGTVVLKVKISSEGEQTNITVISSSGYSRLDRAAIRTLERASFAPARTGGREVASTKQITVTFKLEEAGN